MSQRVQTEVQRLINYHEDIELLNALHRACAGLFWWRVYGLFLILFNVAPTDFIGEPVEHIAFQVTFQ